MSQSNIKDLRKQVKNVCQEMAGEILTSELQSALYKNLMKEIETRLNAIDKGIKDALAQMEDRQKTVQGMLMKEMAANQKFAVKAD